MNEQLQAALAAIIEKAMSGLDASVKFLSAEVPDVISQLLLWYAVSNLVYAVIGGVIMYISYLLVKKPKGSSNWMWYYCSSDKTHTMTSEGVFGIFLVIPFGAGLLLLSNVMTSLKIWIAPKIWLIEYASSLVK